MSILEDNFNQAIEVITSLVEQEKEEVTAMSGNIIVQVAYNEESFKLSSIALNTAESGKMPDELTEDIYYNMSFVVEGVDNIVSKFRDKYLFKLAYADIHFALFCAYRNALMSESGEYTYKTSFYKPNLDDWKWAYKEVFEYTNLGHFRCWLNFDDDFKNVDVQADNDMINQYHELMKRDNS